MVEKRKKGFSGKVLTAIILLVVTLAGSLYCFASVYSNSRSSFTSIFEHSYDYIDLNENKITYDYKNLENNNRIEEKTYYISADWLDSMAIRDIYDDNDYGYNITIYGPYTWLPAGKYKVKFDLTDYGFNTITNFDVGVNWSANRVNVPLHKDNLNYNYGTHSLNSVTSISDIKLTRNSLEYIVSTNGSSANYELRTFYNGDTGDLSKGRYISNMSITACDSNKITFDSDGGTACSTIDTYWGQTRPNAPVPTKTGYTFLGWYGYRYASNGTDSRDGLTFNTSSDTFGNIVKIWDSNGNPTGNTTEVSYYNYTVKAEWTPNTYYVQYDNNWGNNADWGDGNGSVNVHWQTCTYDSPQSVLANRYTRDGYVFLGWNTERNGSGTWYNVSDTFINLVSEMNGIKTLYAQWGVARSFVEYYGNGNTEGSNYIKGHFAINITNDKYDDGSAFSKKGHSFD